MVEGYEKIGIIGKGSFGTATLNTRIKDNKLVVLKEITTSDMEHDEKISSYNEIKILSALDHTNIIRYFDSVIKQDFFIIIMDYADGGNLAQLINLKKSRNEVFKEKGIFFIIFQITDALSYMHGKKILHRDLKSANIFITSNGTIKLGDFGISKMLSTKSQADTVVGTPYYLSPEMCEGHQYDEKSDIWALGCIIYEMAALRRPFNAPNLPLLVQKIIRCEYDDIPYFYCKDLTILLELILQKNTIFRPTAKFIHDVIIPDVLTKNGIHFDYDQIMESNDKNISRHKERSVLYEITNNDGEINVQPKILPHKKIVDFSISSTHSVVIFKDHSVYAWGSNKYCELGVNNAEIYVEHPVYVKSLEHLNVIKCAIGENFSLFLTKYGQLYSSGHGATGCLGHGNWSNVYFPVLIKSLTKNIIKDIICGNRHAIALDIQGKVYVWGSPKFGHGLDNNGKRYNIPIHLQTCEKIQKIFCTDDATIILSIQNSIFVSGNNKFKKLGIKNKDVEIIQNFRKLQGIFGEILHISMSGTHTAIVNTEGIVFLLGDNTCGQLGKNNGIFRKYENFLNLGNRIMQCACTTTFTIVFDEKNILWFWGTFKNTKCKDKTKSSSKNPLENQSILSLSENKMGNFDNFRRDDEIQKIRSILALYSSKENVESGNFIEMSRVEAVENSIFLLVDTTCPAPYKRFSEPYNIRSVSNLSHATTRTYCNNSSRSEWKEAKCLVGLAPSLLYHQLMSDLFLYFLLLIKKYEKSSADNQVHQIAVSVKPFLVL